MAEYINCPILQHVFIDKDTSTPLIAGKVYFYHDNDRSTLKDIYVDAGTPGNPVYVATSNPQTLDNAGSFQQMIYLYPYDASGKVDTYYVEIYSAIAGGPPATPQRTIENFPALADGGGDDVPLDVYNYINNGQFLLNQTLPATDTKIAGEIRAPITNIAYGGWTFERPEASTAQDIVTFVPFNSWVSNPDGNPRYQLRVQNTGVSSGDGTKDVRIKFKDVNFFASDTKKLTVVFDAKSNGVSTLPVSFGYIKNFGTGGSTQVDMSLETFTIETAYEKFSFTFTLGDNSGQTLSTLQDDYLQLYWRLPTNATFDFEATSFMLLAGEYSDPSFEEETPQETIGRTLGGSLPVPASDGSDLYLPIVLTTSGFIFDDAEVGQIKAFAHGEAAASYKPANGAKYETALTDPDDGIPYSRLQSKIGYTYGTGADYFQASDPTTTNTFNIGNNTPGSVSASADGAVPTGFTFVEVHAGANYKTDSVLTAASTLLLLNNNPGVVTTIAPGTSGFTVAIVQKGSAVLPEMSSIVTTVATALKGKYFNFQAYDAGAPVLYYLWYADETGGTDPAPPALGAGIKVIVNSADSAAVVAVKTMLALKGGEVTNVTTVAGSAVPANSYFTISSTASAFYVWYQKDGTGIDPAISGKIGIEVDILTADTDDEVATKTHDAINNKYFATPDVRGTFLRGWDNGAGVDQDSASRWSHSIAVQGDAVGTFQFSANLEHSHIYNAPLGGGSGPSPAGEGPYNPSPTNLDGTYEARPVNMYVNYQIKY